MSDWTCTCGRTLPADRTKCPACGARREEAPAEPAPARSPATSASGRLIGRAPSSRAPAARAPAPPPSEPGPPILRSLLQEGLAPIDPAPPGAPPVSLVSRTLQLELPRWCCCCLGPASGIKHSVAVGERGGFGVDAADSLLGLAALMVTGYGWITYTKEDGFESTLGLPICAPCRHHATALERAAIRSGAAGLVAFLVGLVLVWPRHPLEVLLPAGVGLAAFLLLTGLQTQLIPRPGPQCCGSRPIGLRWGGERFTITFGNPAYGRRVAAMNPRVLE